MMYPIHLLLPSIINYIVHYLMSEFCRFMCSGLMHDILVMLSNFFSVSNFTPVLPDAIQRGEGESCLFV